jgi:Papain-like cysteine protease AvrRpt2
MSAKCSKTVPFRKQSTPTTCWHASLQMLADYHGYDLVTNIGVYVRCLTYMKQLQESPELAKRPPPAAAGISVEETNALCDKNALNAYQKGSEFAENQIWEMVETLLTGKGPVIVLINMGTSDWVHWIVVTETVGGGLNQDRIFYHDPAVGPDQKMTLQMLKRGIVGVMFREPAFVKRT